MAALKQTVDSSNVYTTGYSLPIAVDQELNILFKVPTEAADSSVVFSDLTVRLANSVSTPDFRIVAGIYNEDHIITTGFNVIGQPANGLYIDKRSAACIPSVLGSLVANAINTADSAIIKSQPCADGWNLDGLGLRDRIVIGADQYLVFTITNLSGTDADTTLTYMGIWHELIGVHAAQS